MFSNTGICISSVNATGRSSSHSSTLASEQIIVAGVTIIAVAHGRRKSWLVTFLVSEHSSLTGPITCAR